MRGTAGGQVNRQASKLAPLLTTADLQDIERFAATLFGIVGLAFAVKAATG